MRQTQRDRNEHLLFEVRHSTNGKLPRGFFPAAGLSTEHDEDYISGLTWRGALRPCGAPRVLALKFHFKRFFELLLGQFAE
jgi:hypothetical protein